MSTFDDVKAERLLVQNQESDEEKLRSEQPHRFLTQEASAAKCEHWRDVI